MWCLRRNRLTQRFKNNGPDGSLHIAGACQHDIQLNSWMVSKGFQLHEDWYSFWIHMAPSSSFVSTYKCALKSNNFYQLNYFQPAQILKQRSNSTTQQAKNTLINCMWYWSRFRCKAGLLRNFPLFSPETRGLESAVYFWQKNFCLAHHFCWMHGEKTTSMKEHMINTSLHLQLFTNQQIEQPNICKSLVFLEIHH